MTRVLSAAVGIPLVVAAIYLSSTGLFAILAVVLAVVALWEYLRLSGVRGVTAWAALAGGSASTVAAAFGGSFLAGGAALLILLPFSLYRVGDPADRFRETADAALGMVYISYAFGTAAILRAAPSGESWLMMILIVLWAGDSAAYYAGRAWGQRKLAPLLSPNKTWEGAAAGLAGSAAAGTLFALLFIEGAGMVDAALLSAAVGAAGQAGDIVQSLWKRARGVKDSGALIPGHGGLLDRIDSLLLGLPVGYNLLKYLIG